MLEAAEAAHRERAEAGSTASTSGGPGGGGGKGRRRKPFGPEPVAQQLQTMVEDDENALVELEGLPPGFRLVSRALL